MNQVKAIILAGGQDFGRCPISSKLPPCLWPKFDKPVLKCLLEDLNRQNIGKIVICPGKNDLIRDIIQSDFFGIEFLDEQLPYGTAGCLREVVKNSNPESLFLIINSSILSPPDFKELIEQHEISKCEMSIVLEPEVNFDIDYRPSEIFVCDSSVLKYIPAQGFFDLKEGLIAALTGAGKSINPIKLKNTVGHYRTHEEYIYSISDYLKKGNYINEELYILKDNVWVSRNAIICDKAKIYGPAVVMANSIISENSTIFGPSVVGKNVFIGENTFIENSVLWDHSVIGNNCCLKKTLVDNSANISSHTFFENAALKAGKDFSVKNLLATEYFKDFINSIIPVKKLNYIIGFTAIAAIFIWSYWFNLVELFQIWSSSDEYSIGLMVPLFAGYILWERRKEILIQNFQICLWGLFGLIFSQLVRYFGILFMYSSAERYSIIFSFASVILLFFGWNILRKSLPLIFFLFLMLPLPRSVHSIVMLPLQNFATKTAVFCLELLGYPVIRQGNIIELHGTSVAISEACNGLRMIMAFLVVTAFIVLLMNAPLWKKIIILISSLPIAVLCNTIRLTGTTLAFNFVSSQRCENLFHSFGGYAMMPMAILIIFLELRILSKITFN